MMLMLGALIALLAVSVGSVLGYVIPLADLLIFLLGALLLLSYNPFKTLPSIKLPTLRHSFANAYVYGLLYGPIALPCSGPMLVSIFALSFTVTEMLSRLWMFLWFGMGLGIPLLVISLLSGVLQRRLTAFFASHSQAFDLAGGLLLIGIALLDLSKNWAMLRFYFRGV